MELILPQSKIQTDTTFNQDYFKTWTENMAYTLGLLNSSGFITTTNVFDITLPKKDKYLLKQIAQDMGYIGTLQDTVNRQVARLTFCSQKICDDIVSIHVLDIPKKYYPHFVRGSLDGRSRVNRLKGNRLNIVFQENEFRVIEIILRNELNLEGSYNEKDGTVAYGNKASRKIGAYIYANNPKIFSKRKRDKFEN